MKWRCTWCGKPHAEDDPPCDECGHNVFEEAVVRADEDDSSESHTVDTGPTYVWACPNCGREHVRNNPPCARCGNPDLEKTKQTYDDVDRELEVPGWIEVAKPYAPAFLVVGIVVLLFATGIIPFSVLPGIGTPSPPDAPGEGTEVAGLNFEVTEREIHEQLAAQRDGAETTRTYDDGLAAYAEYRNRQLVIDEYTDDGSGETPAVGEFDPDCTGSGSLHFFVAEDVAFDEYDDERALAADLADDLRSSRFADDVEAGHGAEGMDLHVTPGDRLYVMYAVC